MIAGVIFSSIGALGNLFLWILSKILEGHYTIPITKSNVMIGNLDISGTDFFAFISEYRLTEIFYILLVFLIVGVASLFIRVANAKIK